MAKMLLHICENTRLSLKKGARGVDNRRRDILNTVRDAKKICDDASHIGRGRTAMTCEEVLGVVHDAAEYLESLLDQKTEDETAGELSSV